MECLYVVFAPHNEAAPDTCLVVFKYGTQLKKGEIKFDSYPFTVPEALTAIDAAQHLATDWCSERRLDDAAREEDSPAKSVPIILRAMERSIGNMVDEAVQSIPTLERLLKRDQLDEMEGDLSNAHFQLSLRNEIPVFSAVDMILYRGFPSGGSVRVNCVYEEGKSTPSFHFTIEDGTAGENLLGVQSLTQTRFPNLSRRDRGEGYKLLSYDEDSNYRSFTVYGDLDTKTSKKQGPGAAEAVETVTRGTGYNQSYIVRRLPPGALQTSRREMYFRCGNFCYNGVLDLGCAHATVDAVPRIVPALQRQQAKFKYMHTIEKALTPGSPYFPSVTELERATQFLAREIGELEGLLMDAVEENPHLEKWIMERDDVFFELQTSWNGNGGSDGEGMQHVADVELMASKTYLKGLILVVIYSEGSYFAQVQDGGNRSQALLDVKYPDLSDKGRGHKVKSFAEDHPTYTDLYIWAPSDAQKKPAKPKASASSSAGGGGAARAAESKQDLMGEGGAYNQTYVVFKNIIANQTLEPLRRDVFFRFGRWCYAGNVEIGTETLQLSDVPLVAPILQSQQSKLKYFCLAADIPSTSSFYEPMERMREACNFLVSRIMDGMEEMEEMATSQPDDYAWLLEDDAKTFFELRTDGKHQSQEVDFLAAKVYGRLIFVTVYFQGSYYLKVQDSQAKTHHLLDASFPSFNNKARGLTLTCEWKDRFTDPDFHFREMCVWEQVVRAVPLDFAAELKKAAEKRARRVSTKGPRKQKIKQKPRPDGPGGNGSGESGGGGGGAAADVDDVDDLEDARPGGGGGGKGEGKEGSNSKPVPNGGGNNNNKAGGGKREKKSKKSRKKAAAAAAAAGPESDGAGEEEDPKKELVDLDVHAARNPHFVAKIALPDRLKHLQAAAGPAPWDASGKPLLFNKK